MRDVSKSITKINEKSQLYVVRGPPVTVLPALWEEWGITDIVWWVSLSKREIGRPIGLTFILFIQGEG